jgi:hypothetical protein
MKNLLIRGEISRGYGYMTKTVDLHDLTPSAVLVQTIETNGNGRGDDEGERCSFCCQ